MCMCGWRARVLMACQFVDGVHGCGWRAGLYLGTILAGFAIHSLVALPIILLVLAKANPLKSLK